MFNDVLLIMLRETGGVRLLRLHPIIIVRLDPQIAVSQERGTHHWCVHRREEQEPQHVPRHMRLPAAALISGSRPPLNLMEYLSHNNNIDPQPRCDSGCHNPCRDMRASANSPRLIAERRNK